MASESLGMNRLEQLTYVIVPQAIRIAIPPTIGFMVQIIKSTSITALIGFVELVRAAQIVNNATFMPGKVFSLIAILYFLFCFPLTVLSRTLERRLNVGRATERST
jgi:polar amino acid transport system permease protein